MATFFENIITGWKYSFSLFRWDQIKQIFGASIITAKRGIKLMWPYGLGLLTAITAISVFVNICWQIPKELLNKALAAKNMQNLMLSPHFSANALGIATFIVLFTIFFLTFGLLSIRTSTERKDWCYFLNNNMFYVPLAICVVTLPVTISKMLLSTLLGSGLSNFISQLLMMSFSLLPFLFFDYKTEFYTFQALKRAITRSIATAFYFTPALFLSQLIMILLMIVTSIPMGLSFFTLGSVIIPNCPEIMIPWVGMFLFGFMMTIIAIILFSPAAVIYLKLKHEQRKLFLGE